MFKSLLSHYQATFIFFNKICSTLTCVYTYGGMKEKLKASLTSHRTCTYVLVTEKNRLICKGPSRHTYDFRTKYQGCTGPTMKAGMHIFPACTQGICKRIHASRVTYERLVHVHSPCKCCRFSPIIYIV